jgi:hypothetical protein
VQGRAKRIAIAWIAIAAAALILPGVVRAGSVAAEVQVTPTQDQAGKEIRIVAFVIAHEPLTVSGRGKIRIGGEFRRLYPKGGQRDLTVDEGYAVKLRPTPKVARQIARALTEGQVLHASFTVTLTNEAGVVQATDYRVRVTKFREP